MDAGGDALQLAAIRWQGSLAESLPWGLCSLSLTLCAPPYLRPSQNAGDSKAVEELMVSLDENNDGELTFSEFWQLIGKLAAKQGGFGP